MKNTKSKIVHYVIAVMAVICVGSMLLGTVGTNTVENIPIDISLASPALYATEHIADSKADSDGHLKILVVGNSFSQDAVWYREGFYSHTYKIMRSLLRDDVDLTLGIAMCGGKTLAWHATKDRNNIAFEYFRTVSSEDAVWQEQGVQTLSYALSWTDWDVVSLQPYSTEEHSGIAYSNDNHTIDEDLGPLSVSVPYLLDQIQEHAPSATVYYYLVWARGRQYATTTEVLAKTQATYEKNVHVAKDVLTYTSTDGKLKISGIIPIGTAIQNARSTYLGTLGYNIDQEPSYDTTDTVLGLQRDSEHLSYSMGRYIAGLTLTKTVIPPALLNGKLTDAGPISSQLIGAMPDEYVEIARKAVNAAIQSPLAYTAIPGYETAPAALVYNVARSLITQQPYNANRLINDITEVAKNTVSSAVLKNITISIDATCGSTNAVLNISYGYTTEAIPITLDAVQGHTEQIDAAVPPSCTQTGLTEGKHCSGCQTVLLAQQVVPKTGHAWDIKHSTMYHWFTCSCGEKSGYQNHEFDGESVCRVCGVESVAGNSGNTESAVIYIVIGCIVLSSVVLVGVYIYRRIRR